VKVCISADIEGVAGIAYDIPGVTVSIVKDDKRIFAKGYVKPK
jgi:D-aminopeptidase